MPGGQPSTTQPIAAPWLSPKVVTRNMWPKVLKDIAFHPRQSGSPQPSRGQMARSWLGRAVARHAMVIEDVDHGMLDTAAGGGGLRLDAEMHQQRAGGAKMRGDHRVAGDLRMPIADARQELCVAFAARRHEMPGVLLAHRQGRGLP